MVMVMVMVTAHRGVVLAVPVVCCADVIRRGKIVGPDIAAAYIAAYACLRRSPHSASAIPPPPRPPKPPLCIGAAATPVTPIAKAAAVIINTLRIHVSP
jgi:hypothetical protein